MKSRMGVMFIKNWTKYAKGLKLIDIGYITASVGILLVGAGSLKLDNATGDGYSGYPSEINKLNETLDTVCNNKDMTMTFGVHPKEEEK